MEAVNINFTVINLTRLGMKTKSTAPEEDALTTRPSKCECNIRNVWSIVS